MVLLIINSGCGRKPEQGKILLRWSGYAYPVYDEFRTSESKKFEMFRPELKVRYEPITGSYRDKILTQIAGGVAPDMFFADDTSSYINKGVLVDLTSYVEKDKDYFENIYPSLRSVHVWDGKVYAIPGNCNIDVLYYNKKLFDKAGISYPDNNWTWEDLLGAGKRLTIRDDAGRTIQYGCVVGHVWSKLILYSDSTIWNEEKTRCIINTPETREAIQFWKDLYSRYKVSPSPKELTTTGERELFIMGKAGMYLGGSWETATFKIKKSVDLNWDVALIPKRNKDNERFVGLDYLSLGIWSGSKHPELAYELAKFMITPERIKFLVEVGDSLPIHPEGEDMSAFLNDVSRPEKSKQVILSGLKQAKSYYRLLVNPEVPYMEQEEIINRTMSEFAYDIISAKEALEKIEEKLNSLLNRIK